MEDRTVVLTGAGGGIGLQLTDYLLRHGVRRLACQYRTPREDLFALVREHGLDPASHCFQAELSDAEQVSELARTIGEAFGPPWGLINLAGATSNGMSWKLSLEDFQSAIADNLITTFLTCRAFIPAMREAQSGRIINISSVAAFRGAAGASHYCSAKAAVVGFTRSIAQELVSRRITANVLALGYFDYGMLFTIPDEIREQIRQDIPAGRFGSANEVGGMVAHLLGEDASYTTGQVIHINGGMYG
jgi:3-oxoacyl-[acyl-carrier protein] reductase